MFTTIIAKKVGMTGKFTPEGKRVGVTILSVLPMKVKGLRDKEKHGYEAVQVEIAHKGGKTRNKEFRTGDKPEIGIEVKLEEVLKVGDNVKVTGVSKGKGFAGAVKRYGFAGGPRTHGQSDRERAPGSSGSGTTPGRVYKGKRRAGHMGDENITISGLKVLELDAENKMLTLIGSIPGNNRGIVTVTKI